MKPGDRVQVLTAWAAQGGGRPPLKSWMSGYEFVRMRDQADAVPFNTGDVAVLRHLDGLYEGLEVNHPIDHVRPEPESDR